MHRQLEFSGEELQKTALVRIKLGVGVFETTYACTHFVVKCKCNLCTHGAPKNSLGTRSNVTVYSRSHWNLEMLVFRREENRSTRRKTLGAETRTNNKLNPHMTPRPGIEPGPHWWEACVGGEFSTTAPSLLK